MAKETGRTSDTRMSMDSAALLDTADGETGRIKKCVFEDFEEMQEELLERMNMFKKQNIVRHHDDRRLRILDRLKKKIADTPADEKTEEKRGRIEQQLDKNDKVLSELLELGRKMIENITVDIEQRENKRFHNEYKRQEVLKSSTAAGYAESLAEFDNIVAKWSELDEIEEPILLAEKFEEQKASIARLMEQKNQIILQCQQEFDHMNREYYEEEQKQVQNMCLIMERINAMVDIVHDNNKQNLQVLEDVVAGEREQLKMEAAETFNELMNEVLENNKQKHEIKKGTYEYYANKIKQLISDQGELTYSLRKRLETDIETLQIDIYNQRQAVLIASEKLEYNAQVLVMKNSEELTLNNQQKRRVAKQLENITDMKKKIEFNKKQNALEMKRLHSDIDKISDSLTTLTNIGHSLRINNKKKFDAMWNMNFKDITILSKKLFEIDKMITEQQMVLQWQQPDIDFTDMNANSTQSARKSLPSVLAKHSKPMRRSTRPSVFQTNRLQMRLVRSILRQLADRAGFLVETKLLKILEPYSENDNYLLRLENIFNALRISHFENLKDMTDYFEKYAWCPNCEKGLPEATVKELLKTNDRKSSLENRNIKDCYSNIKFKKCSNHYLVVEKAFVLTVLNEFMEGMRESNDSRNSLCTGFEYGDLIEFKDEVIFEFFSKFENCIPSEKIKLWKTLEHGLNHYIVILRERKQLVKDCQELRQQNRELNFLLTNFACG